MPERDSNGRCTRCDSTRARKPKGKTKLKKRYQEETKTEKAKAKAEGKAKGKGKGELVVTGFGLGGPPRLFWNASNLKTWISCA